MGLFDWLRRNPDTATPEERALADRRRAEIAAGLSEGRVPAPIQQRLDGIRAGRLPWIATLTPAELMIARSHGFRPIAAIAASCWLHYGWSWTEGHGQGWHIALDRLRQEARAAGANAVVDVKMRTVPLRVENSMDFTLVGTAVRIDGLPASPAPIVATLPALEFARLLEADVVPTGIAVGAAYEWLTDWRGTAKGSLWRNVEAVQLSQFWSAVRGQAHGDLRRSAQGQGNGVLAHVNFSQMLEFEGSDERQPKRYLGRHIVIATTVDARRGVPFDHGVEMAVDLQDGASALTGSAPHHQAYGTNEREGGI